MTLHTSHTVRGFTLIEILVVVGIVGTIAVVLQLALSEGRLIKVAKGQEIALRVASNKLEDLRAGGYDNVPVSGTFSDTQLATLASSTATLTVTDANVATKQVVVTVSWKEAGVATLQTITLSSLITDIGGL